VNTGTLLAAKNASELAGVIAHEIGHVAYRHVANNYNRQRTTGLAYRAGVVAAWLFGGGLGASAAQLGGGLAAMAYLNQFGREAEMQADAFAVAAMPRAGWDPNGLLTFFETLQGEGGPHVPAFLSSHPATQDRIDATRTRIAELRVDRSLRRDDGGKLEIIQRRIEILTGASRERSRPRR
jgi:predicted Zn-dependent protease